MALGMVGEMRKPCGEIGVLARLNEPEMPFGQGQRFIAGNDAEHRHARGLHGFRHQDAMALAADAVEQNAGDAHRVIVRAKAARHRGGGLRLAGDVENEQHGKMEARGEIGRCAAPSPRPGKPVEQAKHAFDHEHLRIARRLCSKRVEKVGRHRPAVEIDARAAGRRGMEGGIDVIGARFRRADRNPSARQRGEQRERHRRLAGARTRCGDDEAARGHVF